MHRVATWHEAAPLGPVAVHGDRLLGERLVDEPRDHHPVAPGLARPDRVEQARDDRRQPALAPVGDRQELVERLRARVRPPAEARRTHQQVAVLAERHPLALAVDLARRRDEHRPAPPRRLREDDLGAVDVGLDRPHRALDDQLDADGGGEVVDDVGRVDELGDDPLVGSRVDRVFEPARRAQMLDVRHRPCRQIVEHVDLTAARDKRLGQVGPDESGSARDQEARQVDCAVPWARARMRPAASIS